MARYSPAVLANFPPETPRHPQPERVRHARQEDEPLWSIQAGRQHCLPGPRPRSGDMTPGELWIRAISGIPGVRPGDDLAELLADAIVRSGEMLRDGDVLVVAQKIVSKAEGRIVRLADVVPSPRAVELAARTDKDPRAVEVILGESVEVLRAVPGVLIVETRHGIVLANAGADMSNIEHDVEDDHLLLLPEDPDACADRLRAALAARMEAAAGFAVGTPTPAGTDRGSDATGYARAGAGSDRIPSPAEDSPGVPRGTVGGIRPGTVMGTRTGPGGRGQGLGVIVADSVGRAWREGTVGLAIGVSGLPARLDRRGEPDLFGRALHVTEVAIADSIASAASIVMGEGAEGRPAALVRGFSFGDRSETERAGRARDLVRPRERDLFR